MCLGTYHIYALQIKENAILFEESANDFAFLFKGHVPVVMYLYYAIYAVYKHNMYVSAVEYKYLYFY